MVIVINLNVLSLKVYYVCNQPGEPWICLPDVTPEQIRTARLTVRCMTGDLDAEVGTTNFLLEIKLSNTYFARGRNPYLSLLSYV